MPAVSATAPGKVILVGEHAVVYGQPAIAVPVKAAQVKVFFLANPAGLPGSVHIQSSQIGLDTWLDQLPSSHPLKTAVQVVQDHLGINRLPAMQIKISSTIPLAAGMGSSAAVSVALIRGLSQFLGHPLSDMNVNELAYQVEVQQHGTPSGIDNTVISFGRPIYFIRNKPFEILKLKEAISLVIADSGTSASTFQMVSGVRERFLQNKDHYERIFTRVGQITRQIRKLIESGPIKEAGPLLTENHQLLKEIGVSTDTLDKLVDTALQHGAFGAKLSGGGGGGNMIALVNHTDMDAIASALSAAGAVRTVTTNLLPEEIPGDR